MNFFFVFFLKAATTTPVMKNLVCVLHFCKIVRIGCFRHNIV